MAPPITNYLLSPALTGALLFAVTLAPEQFREPLLHKLREYVSARTLSNAVTTLKYLFGLTLAGSINSWLSKVAHNNFRLKSEKSRYDWPNEIAVITGATGGFGSLMSKGLASRGVTIIALDLQDELPDHLKGISKIHYYKCDITDRQAVLDLAAQVKKEHGNPSILINNAGVAHSRSILEFSEKELNLIFDVNVISHFYTTQAFLPAMIEEKKGHIITIASVASFVSPAGMVSYSSSKAAAMAFHEGLTSELHALHNVPEVKTTIVHPTFSSTNMIAPFQKDIAGAGLLIIKPEVVSDAVVKQILSCKGGELILSPGTGLMLSVMRALPSWISWLLVNGGQGGQMAKAAIRAQ